MRHETIPQVVRIGDLFRLKVADSDPWASEDSPTIVRVIDLRAGWVRYAIGESGPGDFRRPLDEFVKLYEVHPDDYPRRRAELLALKGAST